MKPTRLQFPGYDSDFLHQLKQIGTQKLKQLALKKVLFNVDHSYSKTVPVGSALNSKARPSNVDKAVEDNRRRVAALDRFARAQMSKMHFQLVKPDHPFRNIRTPNNKKSFSPRTDKKVVELVPEIRNTKRGTSTQASPRTFTSHSPRLHFRRLETGSSLPPHIKSTPMHQDPVYTFPKGRAGLRTSQIKRRRFRSLDDVVDGCKNLIPTLEPERKRIVQSLKNTSLISGDMGINLRDLIDVIGQTEYQEELNNILSEMKQDRLLNEEIFQESVGKMRDLLGEITYKTIQTSKQEIWRQNHPAFMAFVDGMVNELINRKN